MITQVYDLNMIPGGVPTRVSCSQRDDASRTIVFNMYNGSEAFAPVGAAARIDGTRPDGGTFTTAVNLSGNTATWVIPLDATAVPGECVAELIVVKDGAVLGSANFRIIVEIYARDPDTPVTPEETSLWEQMYNQTAALIGTATAAATAAAGSADDAADSATDAAASAASAASDAQAAAQAIVNNADATPTSGSSNLVKSGGVYSAIQNAIPELDATPTSGSTKGVTSGGVYDALTRGTVIWNNSNTRLAFTAQTIYFDNLYLTDFDALYLEFAESTFSELSSWNTLSNTLVLKIGLSGTQTAFMTDGVYPIYRNFAVNWGENSIAFEVAYYIGINFEGESVYKIADASMVIPVRIIGIKF